MILLEFNNLTEFNKQMRYILEDIVQGTVSTWDIISYEGLIQTKGIICKLINANNEISNDMKRFLYRRVDVLFFDKAKEFGCKYEEYYDTDFSNLKFPYSFQYKYWRTSYETWINQRSGRDSKLAPLAYINRKEYRQICYKDYA